MRVIIRILNTRAYVLYILIARLLALFPGYKMYYNNNASLNSPIWSALTLQHPPINVAPYDLNSSA